MPMGRFGGAVANQFAAGNVYNKYRDSYSPITGLRMGLGAAEQFGGPVGGLTGIIGNWLASRKPGPAMAWDVQRGMDYRAGAPVDIRQHFDAGVPDANWTPQTMQPHMGGTMSGPAPMSLASMVNRQQFDNGPMQTQVNDVNWAPHAMAVNSFRGANGQMVGGGGSPGGLAAGIGRGGADSISGAAAHDYMEAAKLASLGSVQRQQGTDVYGHRYVA